MMRNLRRLALAIGTCAAFNCQRQSADTTAAARPRASPSKTAAVTIPPADAGSAQDEDELTEPRLVTDAGATQTLSPTVVVRGAIARTRFQSSQERAVVLLRGPARPESCELPDGDPEIVMTACGWTVGGDCTSQSIAFKNGVMTNYRARMKVLDAPMHRGARGKIQLEESDDTNVHGGRLDVLVCD